MQIVTHHSNIDLNLQYDCIYYFPSRTHCQLNEQMAEVAARWQCDRGVYDVQQFAFQFHYLPKEPFGKFYESDSTADTPESEYWRSLLKHLLGDESGGVLVARPYPNAMFFESESKENELIIASQLEEPNVDSAIKILDLFAYSVAEFNFQRIVGISYNNFRKQMDFMHLLEGSGERRSMQMIIRGSNSKDKKSDLERGVERKLRNAIEIMGKRSKTAPIEEIKRWIFAMADEAENGTKLKKKHKLLIKDHDLNFEIYVEESAGVLIRCEFTRGPLCKTLYIFLLRHPEGVRMNELSKHKKELFQIYTRLSSPANETSRKEAIEKFCANNKNVISVCRTDIKNTFKEIFATNVFPSYCVNKDKEKLRIELEDEFVELGEMGFIIR